MKKIIKRILIVIGIIIAVLVLGFVGMMWKMNSEMKGFAPVETGQVVDNIFVVKDDFANLFIIQDSTQYIVIDCANSPEIVAEQMQKLGIDPNQVAAVLLTHTDSDHTGALSLFDEAKLFLSKEEEKMLDGTKSRFL